MAYQRTFRSWQTPETEAALEEKRTYDKPWQLKTITRTDEPLQIHDVEVLRSMGAPSGTQASPAQLAREMAIIDIDSDPDLRKKREEALAKAKAAEQTRADTAARAEAQAKVIAQREASAKARAEAEAQARTEIAKKAGSDTGSKASSRSSTSDPRSLATSRRPGTAITDTTSTTALSPYSPRSAALFFAAAEEKRSTRAPGRDSKVPHYKPFG